MLRILGIALVASLALTVLASGHWYVAQRLVFDAGVEGVLRSALVGVVVLGGALLVLQPVAERLLRPPWSRWISWPASLWMGLAFYSVVLLGVSDLLLWIGGATASAADGSADGKVGPLRAAVVAALALTTAGIALRGGLASPALRRVELALPRWPVERDGFRIAQLSDIHIGPILGRRFAREIVDRVNALDADLVMLTGDLVDGSTSRLADEVRPFADLRGRHGVYFVTGNHDHYSGARSWTDRVRELGIRVLRNEHVRIGEGSGAFVVAGVDDHHAHFVPGESGEDLEAALDGVGADTPVLLLAHDPTTFKRAAGMSVDLQVSGHTHGGQIWPFTYLVRLAVPFLAGVYRRGGATLYVSRGTGFWGPPMRLGAPAEITEIVLRSG
ncbi:MAG: metallophosphoesterase [Proteobacteria bacterium]|nr:metallophosphoesterase [Pseudomonadota bacterium]